MEQQNVSDNLKHKPSVVLHDTARVDSEKGAVAISFHEAQNDHSAMEDSSPMSTLQEAVFIVILCLGQFMALAPLGQVLGPLHIIGRSFGQTSVNELSWYLSTYSLTVGTLILIVGGLGDRFGHKRMLSLGYLWLALWSLIAGLSVFTGSEIFFDVCRAFQGIGGAFLTPNSMAVLGSTFPPGRKKAVVFCIFGAMAPTGFFSGALFSSILAQLSWWPWSFWIMAIAAIVLSACVQRFIPSPSTKDDCVESRQPPFDWLGSLTGVSGLVLFNVAWNLAPSKGWSAPSVITLLILGVCLFSVFTVVERHAEAPLVPIREIKAGVILVLACIVFGWSSFGIWVYYWFQFVEVVQGHSALTAVAQHAASPVAAFIAAGSVAIIVTRVKSCWIMLGAELAFITGVILLVTLDPRTSYWKQLFWSNIIMPFGMDMSFPAATLLMSNLVQKRHQGVAASLIATMVNYSIAFGLGIAGTVEVHFNDGGNNVLQGYRAALYAAIGLAGLGVLVAIYFVLREHLDASKGERAAETDQSSTS